MVHYHLKFIRKAKIDHKAELPLQSWGIQSKWPYSGPRNCWTFFRALLI